MKKIIVKIKSTGTVKIPVQVIRKINGRTAKDIIKELDMFNKLIDYHYGVCKEYKNTEDVGSDSMVEYISETIYEAYAANEDACDIMAGIIMRELEDALVEEICKLDDNAKEDYEVAEDGRKGDY